MTNAQVREKEEREEIKALEAILKKGMKSRDLIRVFRKDVTHEEWMFLGERLDREIEKYKIGDVIVKADAIRFIDVWEIKRSEFLKVEKKEKMTNAQVREEEKMEEKDMSIAQRIEELKSEIKQERNKGGGYSLEDIHSKDNELWGYKLQEHLDHHYKGRKVVGIEIRTNLLGHPIFREIHFEDGAVINLCKRARVEDLEKQSWWWRNERHV